jgi:lariat debranching enzyme
VFIGGNHEASNYLRELHYGGWAADNIYFLGVSGVVNITKREPGKETQVLRIGGISGIDKGFDYKRGYHEPWPFNPNRNNKSFYHVR